MKKLALFIGAFLFSSPLWATTFPTIKVDTTNAASDDFLCSGAGPVTPSTGTGIATDATGTSVVLTGANLTSVASDGSAVLLINNTGGGKREFARITSVDVANSSVTVSEAFNVSMSSALPWAIGGFRSTIGSTTSAILFSNNNTVGDAMPGWTVRMQSGHHETMPNSSYSLRRAGDQTSGAITLQGDPTAVSTPVIHCVFTGSCLNVTGSYVDLAYFSMDDTNATKTSSQAIQMTSGGTVQGVSIGDSTNFFQKGITNTSNGSAIVGCEIKYITSTPVAIGTGVGQTFINNFIHNSTGTGIGVVNIASNGNGTFSGNIIVHNVGDGVRYQNTGAAAGKNWVILQNTIDDNSSGDCLNFTGSSSADGVNTVIANNNFTNCGGYGIDFSAGVSTNYISGLSLVVEANNFFGNTSGKYNPSDIGSKNEQTIDPQYVSAITNNYAVGTNVAAKGWPVGGSQTVGNYSNTYSYIDIGASQRQCTGGGSGSIFFQ